MDKKIIITVALISIIISIGTWAMDYFHLVEECVYCRTERTLIGVLGIVMLIPAVNYIAKYVKSYATLVFGFFGAHVSTDQVFMHIQNGTIDIMFYLACCALFILIAQVWLIHYFEWRKNKTPIAS